MKVNESPAALVLSTRAIGRPYEVRCIQSLGQSVVAGVARRPRADDKSRGQKRTKRQARAIELNEVISHTFPFPIYLI